MQDNSIYQKSIKDNSIPASRQSNSVELAYRATPDRGTAFRTSASTHGSI